MAVISHVPVYHLIANIVHLLFKKTYIGIYPQEAINACYKKRVGFGHIIMKNKVCSVRWNIIFKAFTYLKRLSISSDTSNSRYSETYPNIKHNKTTVLIHASKNSNVNFGILAYH